MLDLITSLEKEVKNQDSDLETFLSKEKVLITNGN